ncbi:MAG: 2-dehydropantoate 2-reductase [Betaproteobacteria bacterium]|jgi:2-dehydropantoate 2-reductase|nr:2-dehydropantoate 2-reductase [Betaproteobacteria bacterium]
MKICVYGAGAIGGLIAAWLSRSGHDVSVVARGAQLEAIRKQGLRVRDGANGKVESFNVGTSASGPQDYVIVAVKAQNLTEVADGIGKLLGSDTSIVTAMNGVPWWFFDRLKFGGGKHRLESLDPGGRLSRAMPTERIVGCVVHLAASTPEPGLISRNMGTRLVIGEPGGKNTQRTQRLAEALTGAGFETIASDAIEKEFWVKLLGNVSFNPVSALTVSTADRLIEDPLVKDYMVGIMREVLAIGRAVGVDAAIDPEARIDMARILGKFKTSTLQDLEAGKPLEVDGLLAGTLEIAEKAGVQAPLTQSLFGLVRTRAQATGQYKKTA